VRPGLVLAPGCFGFAAAGWSIGVVLARGGDRCAALWAVLSQERVLLANRWYYCVVRAGEFPLGNQSRAVSRNTVGVGNDVGLPQSRTVGAVVVVRAAGRASTWQRGVV
jgi:hypothetical protein